MLRLTTTFDDRQAVKALGARWDGDQRFWYVPDGVDPAPFARWMPRPDPLDLEPAPHAIAPPPPMSDQATEHLSLSAYLSGVERVVRSHLATPTWVVAEVGSVSLRGPHLYLELVESDGRGKLLAKVRANAFGFASRSWYSDFTEAVGGPPATGMRLLLQVTSTFSTQYGFALGIQSIDPGFTVGEFARKVQRIVKTLDGEGILRQQDRLSPPKDFTRIALVAPESAAGLGDFLADARRLQARGLLVVETFTATFQGERADASLTTALDAVANEHALTPFDACIVLRGGGSQIDLDGCNAINAARRICTMPLPVFTAIGHERDHVALDEVAQRSFDTPSKAIGYIRTTVLERAQRAQKDLDRIAQAAERRIKLLTSGTQARFDLVGPRAHTALGKAAAKAASGYAHVARVSQSRLDAASRQIALHDTKVGQLATRQLHAVLSRPATLFSTLATQAKTRLDGLSSTTEKLGNQVVRIGQGQIHLAATRIEAHWTSASTKAERRLSAIERQVRTHDHSVELADPERILERGFALVLGPDGKPLTDAARLSGRVTLRLRDGERDADVLPPS